MVEDRYLGVKKETSYGTAVTPDKYIDFSTFSVNPTRENHYPVTAQRRYQMWKKEGPIKESGSIEVDVRPDDIDSFLYWGLGSGTTTASGSANAWRHTFVPSEHEIYSFTSEVGSIGTYARRIAGCFITSMEFELSGREMLTCSMEVTGKNETLVAPPASQTFGTELPLAAHEASVSIGGSGSTVVEAWRMTVENDVDTDAFVLGDQFLPAIRLQGVKVTGEVELAFTSWTEFQRFLDNTTATSYGVQESFALSVTVTSAQTTGSSDSGYENYKVAFTLPAIFYDSIEISEERRDRIVMKANYTAVYDSSSGYVVQIQLWNTNATL